MRRLPLMLRVLVILSVLVLLHIAPLTFWSLWQAGDWHPLLLVAPLALLELMRVDIFPGATSFTLGSLGLFFLLSLYGPDWAVAATLFHTTLYGLRLRIPWYKAVYNVGTTTISMWAVTRLFGWADRLAPFGWESLLMGLAVGVYVLLNSGCVALAVSLSTRRPLLAIWRGHFAWVTFQEFVLSATGLALGRAVAQLGWTALLLASPLILLRATYQTYVRSQSEHTQELERFANQLITTLAAVVDARDAYTFGHSTHVARYAVAMGEQMGYSAEQVERLRVGALLHDIGKVGIPESILFKPGQLDQWEYDLMKEHTTIGYRIVSQIERLRYAADVIYQHHEWYNGNGYPRGLKGAQILLDARIVGVADALESMMSDRPYRKGRTLPEALAEIQRWSGAQFDPQVVHALEQLVARQGPEFFVNSALLVDEMHAGVVAAAGRQQEAAAGQMAATVRSGGPS